MSAPAAANAVPETPSLKSAAFRREREDSWRELEKLVGIIEKRGTRALAPDQLERLPVLYRAALSSVSVARAISLDRNVVDYLEALAARAYFCVYGPRQSLWAVAAGFAARRFPRLIRANLRALAVSVAFLVAGAVVGAVLTARDPDAYYTLVAEGMAQGRTPASTTDQLLEPLYHDAGGDSSTLARFASWLFTHNAQVGIVAFTLGFLAGLPVILLMFINGLTIGAMSALYHGRGLATDWWGWILPHGITELFAVALCGAAGLMIGASLLFPGRRSRLDNLEAKGREAALLVMGAVAMLLLAGILEGVFRQRVQDLDVRYAVAGASVVGWTAYVALGGTRRER